MSLVLAADRGDVDPSATLVLVALADCAQPKDGGITWPSKATLSARSGICERQVQEHLRKLVGAGLITAVAYAKGGKGKAVHYKLELAYMLQRVKDPRNAAAHCRVLAKIPGSLPPGFRLQEVTHRVPAGSPASNQAVSDPIPGSPAPIPSSPAHERERPTADEQGLTVNKPGLEPDARATKLIADALGKHMTGKPQRQPQPQPRLKKEFNPEPDTARPATLSREHELAMIAATTAKRRQGT